jgi:hypothetical protein
MDDRSRLAGRHHEGSSAAIIASAMNRPYRSTAQPRRITNSS